MVSDPPKSLLVDVNASIPPLEAEPIFELNRGLEIGAAGVSEQALPVHRRPANHEAAGSPLLDPPDLHFDHALDQPVRLELEEVALVLIGQENRVDWKVTEGPDDHAEGDPL